MASKGEVFVLHGSPMDNPSMRADLNKVQMQPMPGSVKSNQSSVRSVGGLSIFQDPEVSGLLPRDEEMIYTVYDVYSDDTPSQQNANKVTSTPKKEEKGAEKSKSAAKVTKVKSRSGKKGRYIIGGGFNLNSGVVNGIPSKIDDNDKNSNVALKSTKGNVQKKATSTSNKASPKVVKNQKVTSNSLSQPSPKPGPSPGTKKAGLPLTGAVNKLVGTQISQENKTKTYEAKDQEPVKTQEDKTRKTEETKVKAAGSFSINSSQTELKSPAVKQETEKEGTKAEADTNKTKVVRRSSSGQSDIGLTKAGSFTIKSTHNVSVSQNVKDGPEHAEVKNYLEDSLSRRIMKAKKQTEAAAKELAEDSRAGAPGPGVTAGSTSTVHTTSLQSLQEEPATRPTGNAQMDTNDTPGKVTTKHSSDKVITVVQGEKQQKRRSASEVVDHNVSDKPTKLVNGIDSDSRQSLQSDVGVVISDSFQKLDDVDRAKYGVKKAPEASTSTKTEDKAPKIQGSYVKNEQFKAQISMLVGQRPVDKAVSAPSSLERRKKYHHKKLQMKAIDIDSIEEDARATETKHPEIHGNTFPRGMKTDQLIVSSTPTSPIEEVKSTVKSGTVSTLVKDKFKNLNLTGRSMDAVTFERQKSKTSLSDAEDALSPKDPTKKYKFVVEGIDVPAPPDAEDPTSPVSPLSPYSPTSPPPPPLLPGEEGDSSGPSTLQRLKKQGVSYILEAKMAGEIKKRAATVTAKKAYEAVEQKSHEHKDEEKAETEMLVQARARLQKKDSIEDTSRSRPLIQSAVLQEARSKLQKKESPFRAGEVGQISENQPDRQGSKKGGVVHEKAKATSSRQLEPVVVLAKANTNNNPSKSENSSSPAVGHSEAVSHPNTGASSNHDHTSQQRQVLSASVNTDNIHSTSSHEATAKNTPKPTTATTVIEHSSSRNREDSSPQSSTQTGAVTAAVVGRTQVDQVPLAKSTVVVLNAEDPAPSMSVEVESLPSTSKNPSSGSNEPPDSAYQSEGALSPSFDFKDLMQGVQPQAGTVTAGYALQEVAPGVHSHYEAKKTVVKEVKTTKTIVGGGADKESQSQQKAAFESIVTADSAGQDGKPTISSAIRTSTEAKIIEDGKVISHQRSSETKQNKSKKAAGPKAISQEDLINSSLLSSGSQASPGPAVEQPHHSAVTAVDVHHSAHNIPVIEATVNGRDTHTEGGPGGSLQNHTSTAPVITVSTVDNRRIRTEGQFPAPTYGHSSNQFEPVRIESTYIPDPVVNTDSREYPTSHSPVAVSLSPGSHLGSHRGSFSSASLPLVPHHNGISGSELSYPGSQPRERLNSNHTLRSGDGRPTVIPLRTLRVDVNEGSHVEMSTHPSTNSAPHNFHHNPLLSPVTHAQSMAHEQHNRSLQHNRHSSSLSRSHTDSAYDRRGYEYKQQQQYVNNTSNMPVRDRTASPMSPPWRYIKVDESRSGRIPRYRSQDISLRAVDAPEYHDTGRPRARSSGRLNSDPNHLDYVDFTYSDPDLSRPSQGKYSVQRVMERRGMSHVQPLDLHPDVHMNRKQKLYQVNRSQTLGSSKSDRGGIKSPTAVDPTLQDVSKEGQGYHVTLKLNSTHGNGNAPMNKKNISQHEERYESTTNSRAYRSLPLPHSTGLEDRDPHYKTHHLGVQQPPGGPHVTHLLTFQQHHGGEVTVDQTDSSTYTSQPGSRAPPGSNKYVAKVGYYEDNNNNLTVGSTDKYVIKSISRSPVPPSSGDKVHLIADVTKDATDVDSMARIHRSTYNTTTTSSSSQQLRTAVHNGPLSPGNTGPVGAPPTGSQPGSQNGPEPRFSMMINQTMTMDYAPTDNGSPVEEGLQPNHVNNVERPPPNNRDPRQYSQHTKETHTYMISEDRLSTQDMPVQEYDQPQRTGPVEASRHGPYSDSSPIDEYDSYQRAPNTESPGKRPRRKKKQPVVEETITPMDKNQNEAGRPRSPVDELDSPHRAPTVEAPPKRPRNKKRQPVQEETVIAVDQRHERRVRKPMYEDDLQQYLSPTEEQEPSDSGDSQLPRVVRGSILIKNSMDPISGPRTIDIVEGSDSDDEGFTVEDNTNLFGRDYKQARENPLYSSQEDLRELDYPTERQPQFTKVFDSKQHNRARPVANGLDADEYTTEVKVTRDYGANRRKPRKNEHMNGHDRTDGQSKHTTTTTKTTSEFEIHKLLAGAPPDSIKQNINVEREEEEIMGPLPANQDGSDGLLNFDTVSEKVDLGLVEGKAQVAVKVRCERIVPIRGVDDMFKKSSVIVTRLIEIDLFATDERKRLYDHIMKGSSRQMITGPDGMGRKQYIPLDRKLNTKDTFKLYKTFMGLAEADEAGGITPQMLQIDKQVEDERRPDLARGQRNIDHVDLATGEYDYVQGARAKQFDPEDLDRRLEEDLLPSRAHKSPEPDTISYMSAASEVQDILY